MSLKIHNKIQDKVQTIFHQLSENLVQNPLVEKTLSSIPENVRYTIKLQALAFWKIPSLAFVTPRVVAMSSESCEIKIPLSKRSQNHLGSMYFAVLAAGADSACGLMAWKLIDDSGKNINLIFKDFHADFLKRADGDVHFICDEGPAIHELVEKAATSGERENLTVNVRATVPSKYGDDPVARFKLTLSLKRRD
jgi:acyl-coenzyme A thioesterase PaaI-like protein